MIHRKSGVGSSLAQAELLLHSLASQVATVRLLPLPLSGCLRLPLRYGLAALEPVRPIWLWVWLVLELAETKEAQGSEVHLLPFPNLLAVGLAGPEISGVPSLR